MLPRVLQDQTVLMEVSLTTWRSLFDACDDQARFHGRAFTIQELTPSFAVEPPNPALFAAISLIAELGSDDGRTHVEEIAANMQVLLDRELLALTTRELIANLAIRAQRVAAISDLLIRAQMTFRSVDSSRVSRLFVTSESPTAQEIDEENLKAKIAEWSALQGRGEVVSVLAQRYNGEWLCQVIRGDPLKLVPEIRKNSVGPLVYTPAATDLLRYEPKSGRIHVSTRSPQLVEAYRRILGTLIGGNDRYFSKEDVCSLRPLQEQGNGLFERNRVPGIEQVAVTDLLWQKTHRGKVWVSGKDCFQVLDELKANIREGDLVEAKLRVTFTGGLRGRVTLKTPYTIEIKADPYQHLVEQLLDRTGIRGAFDADGMRRSFWDQYPWKLKQSEWRRRLERDFDRLVRVGILRECALEAVTHPDHPAAPGALEVVELSPTETVGVSTVASIGVRTLTTTDVQGFELQALNLVQTIHDALGLEGSCTETAPDIGLWNIGTRTFAPDARMTVFVALRAPDAVAMTLIAQAAGVTKPLVLYPHDCKGIGGVACLPCLLPQGPFDGLLKDAIGVLGWQSVVPPSIWAPADLVVDLVRGEMSFRSVPLRLDPSSRAFNFGRILANAQRSPVTHEAICKAISTSKDWKNFAKDTKREFIEAIDAAFESAGLATPEKDSIVGSPRHAYVLKVPAFVNSKNGGSAMG